MRPSRRAGRIAALALVEVAASLAELTAFALRAAAKRIAPRADEPEEGPWLN